MNISKNQSKFFYNLADNEHEQITHFWLAENECILM